jgi:low temperature requirement protein LtrA
VYFAFTPAVTEHTLRHAAARQRGKAARDLFTFGHFPIVMGILGYAVVVKHMVADPNAPLSAADRWLLFAAMAVFVGGCLNIQWHVVHRLAPERFTAIAVIGAVLLIGDSLDGWAVVGVVAIVLAAMQAITWRRFRSPASPRWVRSRPSRGRGCGPCATATGRTRSSTPRR